VSWQDSCRAIGEGIPKFNKEKISMTRQRILLSFVCALALVLIPLSYSSLWAQATSPSTTQQDRTDKNDLNQNQNQSNQDLNQGQSNQDLNQNQSNQDLNQSNQSSPDVNSSTERQKPSSTENSSSGTQNQNRNPSGSSRTRSSTDSNAASGSENANQDASNQNLPKTAGELPLLALIGLLSLGAAAGTRVLRHVRSNR